jgi:hypothetical protein
MSVGEILIKFELFIIIIISSSSSSSCSSSSILTSLLPARIALKYIISNNSENFTC